MALCNKRGGPKAASVFICVLLPLEVEFPEHLNDAHAFRRGCKRAIGCGRRNCRSRNRAERAAQVGADRVVEVRVVENVEEVRAQAEFEALRDIEFAEYREIDIEQVRTKIKFARHLLLLQNSRSPICAL